MKALTQGQSDVYAILKTYGPLPDVALVPLAQHIVHTPQSSSSIRSRRAELVAKGYAERVNEITTPSGRKAGVFKAVKH